LTEVTCIDIHLSQQRVSGILDNLTALSKGPHYLWFSVLAAWCSCNWQSIQYE